MTVLGNGSQQESVERQQQRAKGPFSPPLPYYFGSGTCWLGSPPRHGAGEGPPSWCTRCTICWSLGCVLGEEVTPERTSCLQLRAEGTALPAGGSPPTTCPDPVPAARADQAVVTLPGRATGGRVQGEAEPSHPPLLRRREAAEHQTLPQDQLLPAHDRSDAPQHLEPSGTCTLPRASTGMDTNEYEAVEGSEETTFSSVTAPASLPGRWMCFRSEVQPKSQASWEPPERSHLRIAGPERPRRGQTMLCSLIAFQDI